MLKGKVYHQNGKLIIEGEMTASDYLQICPNEEAQKTPEVVEHPIQQKLISELDRDAIPQTPKIREFISQLKPKERTVSVAARHFFGHILSAKNRSIYTTFYARFTRARNQVEREEKSG